MSSEIASLGALLALFAFAIWGMRRIDPQDLGMRSTLCLSVIATNALYVAWRWTDTLPEGFAPATWVAWAYLAIETLALLDITLFWLTMTRTSEPALQHPGARPPAASAGASGPEAVGAAPRVEIWIPTYREPVEVLEKAVLASKAVDHPGLQVKVLDDGKRAWLEAMCKAWQVHYITRPVHTHAKAGNLNNALAGTDADFVVTMDADFAPHRDFVQATLPFFEDPRLAILQTPQTFYNPDLAQQNLGVGGGVPDEQALFFREIQPARDAWDSAFYCGSCAMLRVAALREVGGFPTASITEDQLTTLRLLARGWKTRFLNLPLSIGLAAESIKGLFLQRDRWCRGAIEIMTLPEGPLRNPGLTLMQRLLFFPSYWLIHPFFTLAIMLAPVVCLLTGLPVMMLPSTDDIYLLVLPVAAVNLLGMAWVTRGRFSPIFTTAQSMLMALRMGYSAIKGLLGRGSQIFKVTPKGSQVNASSDRLSFLILAALSVLTLVAAVHAGWVGQDNGPREGSTPWIIFLGFFNLAHFLIGLVLVKDRPRLRQEERFRVDAPLQVTSSEWPLQADGSPQAVLVQVLDMSANGIHFLWPAAQPVPRHLQLELSGETIPMELQRQTPKDGAVAAVARLSAKTAGQRQALIQFLFSGAFHPVVQSPPRWLQALRKTARAVVGSSA